jgi:hypothetical protein
MDVGSVCSNPRRFESIKKSNRVRCEANSGIIKINELIIIIELLENKPCPEIEKLE